MLKNYLTITLRNILKNKIYSIINIVGLSVGIAVSILILLFVQNDLTFDSFNKNKDRIYRVITEQKKNNQKDGISVQPLPLGPALVLEYPEIESTVRFFSGTAIIAKGGNKFKEEIKFTDNSIFSVFSYKLLEGDPLTALAQPNSVVLTETAAKKIFGNENPVSKLMEINIGDNKKNYIVTGVVQDVPDNSSIDYNILLPITSRPSYNRELSDWTSFNGSTYIFLSDRAQIDDIENSISAFIEKYFGGYISKSQENGWIDKSQDAFGLRFEALPDVHFSNAKFGMERLGNPFYSYILSIIALIILSIACINFITLSLGKSADRVKEVGVRKVLGANRSKIIKQFWIESFLLTVVSFVVSILIVELLLPAFNLLSGKHFSIGNIISPAFLLILVSLIIFLGFVAGSYPSISLSRFSPMAVFKGKSIIGRGGIFTKSLVVAQFSLAIFLIISSIVVWSQLNYVQTKNLGYNGDQVIVVPVGGRQRNGTKVIDLLKNKLDGNPLIVNIAGTGSTFGLGWSQKLFQYDGKTHETYLYRVDENYIPTLDLKLVEGINFKNGSSMDSSRCVIVNEAFIKNLALKSPGVGKEIPGWKWSDESVDLKIIGVVKNYNFLSLRDKVLPVMLTMSPDWGEYSMMIKISKENIPSTLSSIKKVYEEILPDRPFEFSFLNKDVQKLYDEDVKLGEVVGISSIFAILISCLGLFGLTSLSVSSRTKEVGIRKILGASVNSIVNFISKDFFKLIVLSNIISWPVAWYVADKWLQNFAYRINLNIWIFLVAAGLTLLIVLFTISYHTIKAATANPIDSLRYE